ncbi:PREDICTED: cytochrome P450 4d2-like [Nicrophorus vespilloides]|uniref:Cytochrome P450 4d2-like n=1 Tax=Nicrophorus vespilloides TaxID=110193 RepID=A0ABM1MF23_NICVS|nr:PREDICTED: cytochrome P450 4d2-like [Nicrophorus vespilloides]
MYILYVLLLIICGLILKWISDRRTFFARMSAYPEAKNTLPFLGNILENLTPTDIIPNLLKYRKECGKSFKLILGPFATYVMTTDANFIEFILTSPKLIEKSWDYEFMRNWLGNGLISAPGNIWAKHRKLITPAFHFKILEKMVEQLNSNSSILIKKLSNHVDTEIDIYPFVTLSTLDIICETSMGISFNAQEDNNSKFVVATRQILQIIENRIYSAIKQSNLLYKFTLDYWREKSVVKYLHKITNNIISERREEFKNKAETNPDVDDIGIKKRNFFLDLLLEFGLSNDEIRDEVNTVMFAGHDTTASAISFTLYLLSNNLDVQNKLYEEIASILGSDIEPTYNQFQEMKYLKNVIKESLRLYPPVMMFARDVYEDVYYNDKLIPKGARVGVFVYGLHRESEHYKNPESFIPERFELKEENRRSAFSFVPFSAGQRNCIGQRFAMLSMKSAICKIVRNFEILPVSHKKPLISYEVILKSSNGIYIKLRKRS